MSASTVAAIGALIDQYRQLAPVLEEHLEENENEVLPHLVLADVIRWLACRVHSDPGICQSVFEWLETEFGRGPEDVQGMIRVSGVEMIPDPGEPGSKLREFLGPNLRTMDPWRTS